MMWGKRFAQGLFSLAIMGMAAFVPHSTFAAADRQVLSTTKTSHFTPSPSGQTFEITFTVNHRGAISSQNVISGNAGDSWAWLYDTSNPTTMKMDIGASALSGWEWESMSWTWQISYLFDRTWHKSYSGGSSNNELSTSTWNFVRDLYNVPPGSYELTAQLSGVEWDTSNPFLAQRATGNPYDYFTFN